MKLTKEEKKLIGQRIKQIRREKGMTMEEFGNLLSTSKSIVYRWEIGTNLPNPERLKTIAKLADITVEELLSGSKKDYFLKYAIESLNNILNTKPLSQFDEDNSNFVYKYSEEILPIIEEHLKHLQLSMYSNKDIEKYIDDTINEIVYSTPKDTKELLFDIKRTLSNKVKKIYEYYGEREKYSLSVNISNDLNNKTVTKVLNILNRTVDEIEILIKDCD